MSKLLVVIGATGNQGGSVISSILNDPEAKSQFKIRGITRDTSKPSSKELEKKGIEMVSANLDNYDSLKVAFKDALAVFAVTDYWAVKSKEIEVRQGKAIADAAKAAGVQHFVFSTLINVTQVHALTPATNGQLSKIEHFDGKAEIADYIRSINLPASFYLPGFYMSNLPGQAIRKDDKTGKYIFALPSEEDAQIPLINISKDTGTFVKAILLNREKTLGKNVYGAVDYYTPKQVIEEFENAFPADGKGIQYFKVPKDGYIGQLSSFGMPQHLAEELYENMILLNKDYGYYAGAKLDESLSLVKEKPMTLGEYFKSEPKFKDLK